MRTMALYYTGNDNDVGCAMQIAGRVSLLISHYTQKSAPRHHSRRLTLGTQTGSLSLADLTEHIEVYT